MKIAVIGTGYVGLTTGVCLAELGNEVLCMDIDKEKIENLKKGIIPIYEPGLEDLIKNNTKNKRLNFTTNAKKAIESADIVFSAVSTPPDTEGKADLSYVKQVAKNFGQYTNNYKVFVNKSTVPVGTGKLCKKIIQEELDKKNSSISFDLVSNPEFLKEGTAIEDTMHPDRIIVGLDSKKAKELMQKLYEVFYKKNIEILFTNIQTAEIIKYASNSFLATKISFINEIANFCEKAGGDIKQIAKGIGLDKRIGEKFLNAGIGYGGSCFPKDVQALIQTGKEYNYDFQIIKAAENVNKKQKEILFYKLKTQIPNLKNKTIAIWGLAFKPETDDMREAPAIEIIKSLQNEELKIQVFDPIAIKTAKKILDNKNLNYCNSALTAVKNANALLILTEWKEFINIDLKKVKELMNGNLILDGRNIFTEKKLKKLGFNYIDIGQNKR